jgi:hypothetical protein
LELELLGVLFFVRFDSLLEQARDNVTTVDLPDDQVVVCQITLHEQLMIFNEWLFASVVFSLLNQLSETNRPRAD